MPDWYLPRIRPLSKASAPFEGFDNADIGPSLSHVSLYHTKLLSRTYLYDFVCDVTRFTHLVTSQKGIVWRVARRREARARRTVRVNP